jgi:hypothetical protein
MTKAISTVVGYRHIVAGAQRSVVGHVAKQQPGQFDDRFFAA